MKPLLTLIRNMIVGLCWGIFFVEGVRVIMLRNWRFDIFNSEHWNYAWELWLRGVVITTPKEWAFVLILITFIPLLFTGWAALCLLPWDEVFRLVFALPIKLFNKIFAKPVTAIKNTASVKAVKKKKSYKEIRPRAIRSPLTEIAYEDTLEQAPATNQPAPPPQSNIQPIPIPPAALPAAPKVTAQPITDKFDHSLFQFDDEEDFDFNFDAFEDKPEAPAPTSVTLPAEPTTKSITPRNKNKEPQKNNKKSPERSNDKNSKNTPTPKISETNKPRSGNSVLDVMKQKGWEIITSTTIKGNLIDFIGVSRNQICLCLLDKESGDWLADEERFNDEEPLWFSESSHRISPVRKVDLARLALQAKLSESELQYDISAYVVIPIGNIINAEDMFEIWNNMNIFVTRIDRGSPKELRLFSKTLPEVEEPIGKDSFEKLKKLVRNIA